MGYCWRRSRRRSWQASSMGTRRCATCLSLRCRAPGGARTKMSSGAIAFVQDKKNQQRFLSELKDLLRIPSVSTLPQHKKDVLQAAQFLADELKRVGMQNV